MPHRSGRTGLPRYHSRSRTRIGPYLLHALHAGEGPPVVLVHGLAGSHRWWRSTLPALTPHFRVSVPELVGFGASRPVLRQPDMEAMSRLLVDWMDAVDIASAHLVGHSMGAQVALHVAADAPDRVDRLVLAAPAGMPREFSPTALARFAAEIAPPRAWGDPLFLPTIARDALRAGPRTLWSAARHILTDDVRPLLPSVRSRTLVVYGALDPLIPEAHARAIADAIADARFARLPLAAHNPMLDRPAEFNRLLVEFLQGSDD